MFGEAKDGKIFNSDSPEVKEQLATYPDLNLDAAIGNAIMNYERTLAPVEEVRVEESAVEEPKEEVKSEAAPVAENTESASQE